MQYEKFDFKVKKTEHFDIYYYPEEEQAVDLAARMAERWYARLSRVLRHELSSRQPIILYAAHPHFQQTNALSGEIGEGTGGVTESFKRRVILPFAGGLAETDHVLGHELVHAFQCDISSSEDAEGRPTAPGIASLPLWFIEGMAEYLSLGPVDANTAMWVRDASSREKMPTIDKLDDPTSSRTGAVARSGPTSPGAGAIPPSATCCERPAPAGTSRKPSPPCSGPTRRR